MMSHAGRRANKGPAYYSLTGFQRDKSNIMLKFFSIILSFSLFFSCGKETESSNDEIQEEVSAEGVYTAVLFSVNPKVTNNFKGSVNVTRYGDEFKVNVNVQEAPSGVHRQYINKGFVCPKIDADRNGDGFISDSEALSFIGAKIIPLDDDVSSQALGNNVFPSGASYNYSKSTSYYLMVSDLHLPDENINDFLEKLDNEDLILERRAISVYGSSLLGEVPIACGILTRTESEPPEEDTWNTPLPPRRPSPEREEPAPEPLPEPEPEVGPEDNTGTTWWGRMRQRWRRWRDRWRGGNSDGAEGNS